MKKNITFSGTLVFTLILLFSLTNANAQRGMKRQGSGGRGIGSKYARMYDTKTVEMITGTVINVEKITPKKRMSCGVHLTMKTNNDTISIHLGPAWFIEIQDITIEQNDDLEITGSRIDFEGKPAIIAAKIEKGEQSLVLRDENGIPVWSGRGRRQ